MIRQDRSICVARNESPIRHLFYKSQKQWKAQTAADADARYPFVEIVIIDADGLRTGLNHHLLDLWPSCFPVCLDHKEINSASAIQRRIIMAPIVLITYIMPHSTRSAFRIHSQHHEMLWFHNQFMNSLTLTPTPVPVHHIIVIVYLSPRIQQFITVHIVQIWIKQWIDLKSTSTISKDHSE